jgi:polynucleotide 5'-hydroxyl-kinase GRC3/NOL9
LATPPPPQVEWFEAVSRLSEQSGVVMLVGATDVGKTTLVLAAANAAVRAGRRPAILDTDLGQSEVGPPGTLGIVRLEEPIATASELRPRALAFVGALTPTGHLLSLVQGSRRLAAHALDHDDDVVFVDTSGLVRGRLAEKLKLAKLAVLNPSLVVVVERDRELERLAGLMAGSTNAPVLRVKSAAGVGRKSAVYRRLQRSNRMRKHFENARIQELYANQVRTFDGWVFSGEALPARQLRIAADALGVKIPHGEVTEDGLYLCVIGTPKREGWVTLQEEFGRKRRFWVTPATYFQNLLVGLVGPGGFLLDIGLLQGINFERSLFSVLTPARSVSEVGQIHFGRLRVRPDGSEIAHLRPSDL